MIMRDDALEFSPNWKMDPDFSGALFDSREKDVKIIAYSFRNNLNNYELYITPFRRVNIRIEDD